MDIPICQICGTSESLLRCAKCKTIYYCSIDHQHLDWPTHKNNCKHLSKQKKELQHQRLINSVNNVNIKSNNSSNSCVWPKSINDNSCSVHVHNDTTSMSSNSSVPNVNQMSMEIAMGLLNNTENELVNNPHSNNDAKQILNHFTNGILNEHNNDNCNTFQFAHRTESCILQMTNKMEPCEELSRIIINDLNTYGLSVVDDFLGRSRGLQILNEVHQMYAAGEFQDGQLVSNLIADRDLRTIRGDKITWVMGQEEGCSNIGHLVKEIDAVVIRANKMKDNGKLGDYRIRERTKAMVACYPGSGSHYVKHVDNPNQDGRVITAIYYLNVDWDTKRSGGVLRIFPEGGGESVADVEPKFDRLIFFWSDRRNPHEVQPAHRTRYAITVWYFDSKEREIALKRSKAFRTIANTNGT